MHAISDDHVIKICHWNINGLSCEKMVDIQMIIADSNADIFILSETWLKSSLGYNIDIHGYKSFNFPRPTKHRKARRNSGGLLLYVKPSLCKYLEIVKSYRDRIWLKLKKSPPHISEDIFLCVTYISPLDSSSHCLYDPPWPDLQSEIAHFNQLGGIILIGDLNARIATFQSNSMSLALPGERTSKDQKVNSYGLELMSLCMGSNLTICNGSYPPDYSVGAYTCHTTMGSSCVDYAIVDDSLAQLIQSFEVESLQAFSDHCPISLSISIGKSLINSNHSNKSTNFLAQELSNNLSDRMQAASSNSNSSYKLKWFEKNKKSFCDILKCTPPPQFSDPDPVNDLGNITPPIDNIVNCYTHKILQVAIKSGFAKKIPISHDISNYNKNHKNKYPFSWFDDECHQKKKEVSAKLAAWKHNHSNDILREAYYDCRSAWKRLIKRKKSISSVKWNRDILNKLKENPKGFWKLINNKSRSSNNTDRNSITNSQWEQYFRNLHTASSQTDESHLSSVIAPIQSVEPEISIEEIQSAITELKGGKSPGPDLITNGVLKSLPLPWLISMKSIFNRILRSGDYPSAWAASIIHPIYKSGNKDDPSNYRGISLISCFGKLFTRILGNRIRKWAKDLNVLPKEQFGFQKGKRTTDAIFILNSLAEHQIFKKKKLYCCFVDFKKAFDSVSHSLLWSKLSAMNISPEILSLLKSYYSKSSSCVLGSQGQTNYFSLSKGVKQGCNLSPLLFSLFINDLPQYVHSTLEVDHDQTLNFPSSCLLFADDLVMFSENPNHLQNLINSLHQYCINKHLAINSDKTKILVFGQNPKFIKYQWSIGNQKLQIVGKFKYLGIWLSWNGKFNECISKIQSKSFKSLSNLQIKIISLNITDFNVLHHLFITLIKPILLYGADIWGLYDLAPLEIVLMKYYKFILRVSHASPNVAILAECGIHNISYHCSSLVLN